MGPIERKLIASLQCKVLLIDPRAIDVMICTARKMDDLGGTIPEPTVSHRQTVPKHLLFTRDDHVGDYPHSSE